MRSNCLHWYQSLTISLCTPHHLAGVSLSAISRAKRLIFYNTSSLYRVKNDSKSFTPWKLGGSLISLPTHITVRSILVHLLVETSCNLCCHFSKIVYESNVHDMILLQLSTPFAVGFTQSSSRGFFLYNWLISLRYKQVGYTNLSPSDGSNGAMTLYSPDSNVIFLVFKLIMA
jgi:hypothetical protein